MGTFLKAEKLSKYDLGNKRLQFKSDPWVFIYPSDKIKVYRTNENLWRQEYEPSEYILDVLNEKISIPIALDKIKDEIELSKSLLLLEKDWDSEGAVKIDINIFLSSIKFLVEYSNYIYRNRGLVIASPEINPCINGTIDLSWRTSKVRLLINIRFSELKAMSAYYYGDFYNNMSPIKGSISVNEFSEFLAIWMKNLA